jgi:hypothetical protein
MNKTTILVAVLQLLTLETPVNIILVNIFHRELNLGLVVVFFRNRGLESFLKSLHQCPLGRVKKKKKKKKVRGNGAD